VRKTGPLIPLLLQVQCGLKLRCAWLMPLLVLPVQHVEAGNVIGQRFQPSGDLTPVARRPPPATGPRATNVCSPIPCTPSSRSQVVNNVSGIVLNYWAKQSSADLLSIPSDNKSGSSTGFLYARLRLAMRSSGTGAEKRCVAVWVKALYQLQQNCVNDRPSLLKALSLPSVPKLAGTCLMMASASVFGV